MPTPKSREVRRRGPPCFIPPTAGRGFPWRKKDRTQPAIDTLLPCEVESVDQIHEDVRPGWVAACPACAGAVCYTRIRMVVGPEPFLYCNTCSNILHRRSDNKRVQAEVFKKGLEWDDGILLKHYQQLEQVAPPCPCGGKFEFWAFVKCPHCRQEFPYNAGVRNLKVRLNEDHLIILTGALVLGDGPDDTYRIVCEPEPPGEPR